MKIFIAMFGVALLINACGHKTDLELPSEVNIRPPQPVIKDNATIPDGSFPVQE